MRPLFTVIIIAHCLSEFKWHCTFINIVIMSSSRSWFQIYLICRRKQGAKNYYELKGICRKSILPAKEQRVAWCQEETATDSSKRGKMFAPCEAKSYKALFLPLFCLLHSVSLPFDQLLQFSNSFCAPCSPLSAKTISHCAWLKCHTNEKEQNLTTHTTEYVWCGPPGHKVHDLGGTRNSKKCEVVPSFLHTIN